MPLPFTESQFLENLAEFNAAFGPLIAALWFLTLILVGQLIGGRPRSLAIGLLLSLHWLWVAVAYHAVFFSRINPAAWLFAALFAAQGLALLGLALTGRLIFSWQPTLRHAGSAVLVAFGLAYPALVQLTGHTAPRAPIFGVPCPTLLVTAGLMLAATPPVPRWLLAIPVGWSIVGGSAALILGVAADWMLFAAGAALVAAGVWAPGRRAIGRATQPSDFRQVLSTDIDARPEEIWPWLMQLGYQRGGLYSYDWLDRLFGFLDRPSATSILPGLQDLRPGDVIPIGRGAGFPVAGVERRRSLLLAGEQDGTAWSWELALEPLGGRRTRLVSRTLGRMPPTWGARLFLLALRPAAFLMTRRMLIGIRQRAESLAQTAFADRRQAA